MKKIVKSIALCTSLAATIAAGSATASDKLGTLATEELAGPNRLSVETMNASLSARHMDLSVKPLSSTSEFTIITNIPCEPMNTDEMDQTRGDGWGEVPNLLDTL